MDKSQSIWHRLAHEAFVLGLLIVGILAARSTLADHYYVPSGSMENTLLVGDRVVVDKRAYGFRVPFTSIQITDGDPVRRGDIVIFDSPQNGKRLIKRIVAVGGDSVRIENGQLAINDEWLSSPNDSSIEIIGDKVVALNLNDGGGPQWSGELAAGMVLAIGDHRGNSVDGRFFGAVAEDDIYGRALSVYYRRESGFGWREL